MLNICYPIIFLGGTFLISIITPTYNLEQLMPETIRSIQNQTFTDWEYIIVNDGSKDNTLQVAQEFAKNDSRITVIDQENQGICGARNTGLKHAKRPYICFIDADDLWEPEFLSKIFPAVQGHDFAYSGIKKIRENGKISRYKRAYVSGNILLDIINGNTLVHMGAAIMTREIIDKYNLWFTHGCPMGEDLEFMFKLLTVADVAVVPEELALYRMRPNSDSHVALWDRQLQGIPTFKRALEFIKEHAPGELRVKAEKAMYEKMAFTLFRVVWSMRKAKLNREIDSLFQNPEYRDLWSKLDTSSMLFKNRLQYLLINSQLRRKNY